MHKIIAIALFTGLLTGCETSSQAYNMVQQGADAFRVPKSVKHFGI